MVNSDELQDKQTSQNTDELENQIYADISWNLKKWLQGRPHNLNATTRKTEYTGFNV